MAKQWIAGTGRFARGCATMAVLLATSMIFEGCGDARLPTNSVDTSIESPPALTESVASDPILGQYIVTFADSVSDVPGLAKRVTAQYGEAPIFTYTSAIRGFAARLPAKAIDALQRNPQVERIEQDQTASLAGYTQTPVDWGLDRIDQRAKTLNSTYRYTSTGAGVNAYIIDSGIRTTNVDFQGRAVSGYTVINDGMGTNDCMGHGTHVAGIVGSATYGVAKGVKLYAVRVFDCNGNSTYSGIAAAVDWITKNRVNPAVVNMSLSGASSSILATAIKNSIASGIVYAAAAGNLSADACNYAPGNIPEVITVGAISTSDDQASFSNYGSCVDLFAPGMAVLSTYNTSDTAAVRYSGTSMAAPFVTGAAAIYLAEHPGASPAQVSSGLIGNATTGSLINLSVGSPNRLLFSGDTTSVVTSPTPTPTPTPTPAPTTDQAPVAVFASAGCPRGNCSFDGSASSDDRGIASYSWSFGDGTPALTGSSYKTASHSFKAAGSYTVTLTVMDTAGQSGTAKQTITLKNVK